MINTIDGIIAAAKGGKTGVIAVAVRGGPGQFPDEGHPGHCRSDARGV